MSMEFELRDENPTFFGFGYVSDEAVQQCIDVFNVLNPHEGITSKGLNLKVKDSLDMSIPPKNFLLIQNELQQMADEYHNFFQLEKFVPPFEMLEPIQIQKYPFGGGFHNMHCEKGYTYDARLRELVWMTYLNDVPVGGETFWPFYKKKIKPKKGLTVLWPPQWTHIHKGIPSNTTEKMVATGWFSAHPSSYS